MLKVYCTPSQVKANFCLSFSYGKGTIKNISFTFSAAIHGCAVACKVAVKFAIFGTAAVSRAVLAFRCQ